MSNKQNQNPKAEIKPRTFTAAEILEDLYRIKTVLNTGIFDPENLRHPLRQSAFIEVIICLNDLLQKASNASNGGIDNRVVFKDDVKFTKKDGSPADITDLVNLIRHAVCHINSVISDLNKGRIKFQTISGKSSFTHGGILIESEYNDDLAFFFGENRIYLNRHIIRAYEEVKQKLLPFINQRPEFF